MVLDLNLSERIGALRPLLCQECIQLDDIHRFEQLAQTAQLHNIEVDNRIEVTLLNETLVARIVKPTLGISLAAPTLRFGVKSHIRRLQHLDHTILLETLQHEERSHRARLAETSDIGKRTRLDLAVDMAVVLLTGSTWDILLLKCHTILLRYRYQPQTHNQRDDGDDGRTHKVGPHQSSEAHTTRQHRHNLGLIRQLRR